VSYPGFHWLTVVVNVLHLINKHLQGISAVLSLVLIDASANITYVQQCTTLENTDTSQPAQLTIHKDKLVNPFSSL